MKTAEFVTKKHPDKMCDQVSDAILDYCLQADPNARVAIECLGGHGQLMIMGEITSGAEVNSKAISDIANAITGLDNIGIHITTQSPEIAQGVDTGGAGDQGIMRGYATSETESMMPLEYHLARELCKFLYNKFPHDGKTQITLDSRELVHTIVASFQNAPKVELERAIMEWVEIHQEQVRKGLTVHANPAGDWNQGGFDADTGLTGRKLCIDNYGTQYPVGGGAFSGKDPSKVDRSGAYMARRIAVDILKAQNLAGNEWAEVIVEIAYAIGVAQPVSATAIVKKVDSCFQIDLSSDVECGNNIGKTYDLTPKGIIKALDLLKPQYQVTAEWGHFGNGFTWDK